MRTILFAIAILAFAGCGTIKPIGPLAKDKPLTQQGQPLPNVSADAVPGVRPTPPSMLVTPGDVNAADPYAAVHKLSSELDTDRKTTSNVPVTVEVSRVPRGGAKQ